MRRIFWMSLIFVNIVVFWVLSVAVAGSESLPKEARDRFVKEFQNSIVTVNLPIWGPVEPSVATYAYVTISEGEKEPPHWGELNGYHIPTLVDFLVANGYVKEVERKEIKRRVFGTNKEYLLNKLWA